MRIGVSMFLEFPAARDERRGPANESIVLSMNLAHKNA